MNILRGITWLLTGAIVAGTVIDAQIDTGPVVCTVDPTCRKMMPGEIALALPIFGNTIPYEQVHIFNRPHAYSLLGGNNAIAAVNRSNMFLTEKMGPGRYNFGPDDEHAEDFIHELTHLWQHYAEGIDNPAGHQEYNYNLESREHFKDFNQEQQAEIVLEYFNRHRTLTNFIAHAGQRPGLDTTFRDAKIREFCADLRHYEEKVRQALPITPVTGCPKL